MPKFGNTATTRKPGQAPKIAGTGGGGFLRQPTIVGELIIVTPIEVVTGIYNEGKPDARETRQLKADVVVLTGAHKGNHPGLFLSGRPIIDAGEEIINDQADTVLAGRMTRKPLKKYSSVWATPTDLEKAIADPAVVVPNNAYSWLIPNPSDEDMKLITAFYAGGEQEPTDEDAETEDEDPYAD
jgi:hypothetical protein